LVEVNGSGSVVELSANIIDWGRPTIQSSTSNLKPNTNYVYTIARGTIEDSSGLTNDYYESRIFHTSADIIGPVAMQGGVATGTHAVGTYAYLTGFSSLDVATPDLTLSIPTSPDYLFVQFNEPVRWPAGGWNTEWSVAASNGVIDGVYLKEESVPVYEFGVAYIPARSDYEVGNIHLDLENKTGSDTPNNDEAIWLDLRNGFTQGNVPVGYTLKVGAMYTLVFDVGMYDPMLNFSVPTTPPFEFSFIINPTQQVSLAQYEIASLNLSYTESDPVDNGNQLRLASNYTTTDGTSYEMVDVWLTTNYQTNMSETPAVPAVLEKLIDTEGQDHFEVSQLVFHEQYSQRAMESALDYYLDQQDASELSQAIFEIHGDDSTKLSEVRLAGLLENYANDETDQDQLSFADFSDSATIETRNIITSSNKEFAYTYVSEQQIDKNVYTGLLIDLGLNTTPNHDEILHLEIKKN
jgi:hypothetical protein